MNQSENTKITAVADADMILVTEELSGSAHPMTLHALAEKLAFMKTAGQRTQDVKKYDPSARYEVGDFVFKEYDETLTVGSKSVEHFKGGVILKVIAKAYYPSFKCDMLEVDYAGGGVFRKYIDYMKKTRTQVMLPANAGSANLPAEVMEKGSDPRLTELPVTERDLKALEKNLHGRLVKAADFFSWNDSWQLTAKKVEILEAKVKEIEAEIAKTGTSASTEDLIRRFYGLEASHDLFDIHCLSLDHTLEKKYKRDFVSVSPVGWGRWHLKKLLNAMTEGLPLSAPLAEVPELTANEKPEMSIVSDFPIKVYLTWREILSGGIKIPRSLAKALSHAREYMFTDPEEGKTYTLYYFPNTNSFLGLRGFYADHNIPQGTSLTLERKDLTHFHFWIKKSKKKLSALKLDYVAAEDRFTDSGEDAFTFAEPNKIIYIERELLAHLLPLYEKRGNLDLKDLLILIFKDQALSSPNHALHFLKAYHLADILKQTTQEDVEFTLLNSTEFVKSEKKKGIFFYQEPYVEEEIPVEEAFVEEPVEEEGLPAVKATGEAYLRPGTVGFEEEEEEEPFPDGEPEIIDLTPQIPPPPPAAPPVPEPAAPSAAALPPTPEKAKAAAAAKKEKPQKKRKIKPEGEKGQRPKKSERRVIEEKIAEEESELEALTAVKQKDETLEEQRIRAAREKKEKKEDVKPVDKEEPKFGIFADLLKSALTQKKKEDIPDEEEEKPKE
jgi:hypothetical protein